MQTLKVIYLKSESNSFQWNNGLFAILKQEGDILFLWKISEGKLERYDDGTPKITCTGAKNKGILQTDMLINVDLEI